MSRRRFRLHQFLHSRRRQPTALFAAPPRADDADNPVRLVISGGMPVAIWQAFEQRFGVSIFEFYGASDGRGTDFKPPGVGPVGSIGKPIPGVLMKDPERKRRGVPHPVSSVKICPVPRAP